MKKTVQNYIFIGIGFTVILLLISFHFIDAICNLTHNYNWLVRSANKLYNATYSEIDIYFFGVGFNSFNFLMDVIMAVIIVLIAFMIFFKVKWSENEW